MEYPDNKDVKDLIKRSMHCLEDMCVSDDSCRICREAFGRGYRIAELKYAWHDLRKYPTDLPDVETEVEVVCERKRYPRKLHREDLPCKG